MKISLKRIIVSSSLILNLALAVIFFTPLTEQLYRPLIVDEPLIKAQAIVVLAGDSYSSGSPGFRSITRLKKAMELYRNGWADKIVCIGGTRLPNVDKSISEVLRDTLVFFGIPENDILIDDGSFDTYADITNLVDKFKAEIDFNKTIFVSSSFHTFRIKKILSKKNIGAVVASAEPYELYPNFWTARIDYFRMAAREYMAILYSKLRSWI